MIYILSSKKAAALGLDNKSGWVEIVKTGNNLKLPAGLKIQANDLVYLDISGLTPAELKKALGALKKSRGSSFWGIIDPKGSAEDPAMLFFEGAGDYIGPVLVKKGLNKKRFAAADSHNAGLRPGESRKSQDLPTNKIKLPAGKFEGWKSQRAGTTASFLFLFVSVSGKTNLRSQVGEVSFSVLKKQLRDMLQQSLMEADALLWIETEDNTLFLVPPRASNARAAVEAGLKMLLNSRLICIEKLGLSFPLNFTIAMHYGKTVFRAPGKTGAVVSEPVNYIFHLGAKKAEAGRLTISDEVPEDAIPQGLLDIFNQAGVFEGIPIRHSRRFIYK